MRLTLGNYENIITSQKKNLQLHEYPHQTTGYNKICLDAYWLISFVFNSIAKTIMGAPGFTRF